MNILAIGAHPDDVDEHVGGTLLKYAKAGHRIFIVLTTSGNTGSSKKMDPKEIERIREAEASESAKAYGAQIRFLRADDERLLDTDEMRTKVLDAMRWADPDVIFTHSSDDESTDHRVTSQLVRAMILSLPGVNQRATERPCTKKVSLFMWENDAGVNSLPEVYVDISDEFPKKLEAMGCHRSQYDYMTTFNCELGSDMRKLDAFRGMQCGCEYAECFRAFRIHGYMPDFKLLP